MYGHLLIYRSLDVLFCYICSWSFGSQIITICMNSYLRDEGALPQQQRYFSLGLNSALQLFVKSSQPVLQVRILEICTLMAVRLGMGDPWVTLSHSKFSQISFLLIYLLEIKEIEKGYILSNNIQLVVFEMKFYLLSPSCWWLQHSRSPLQSRVCCFHLILLPYYQMQQP